MLLSGAGRHPLAPGSGSGSDQSTPRRSGSSDQSGQVKRSGSDFGCGAAGSSGSGGSQHRGQSRLLPWQCGSEAGMWVLAQTVSLVGHCQSLWNELGNRRSVEELMPSISFVRSDVVFHRNHMYLMKTTNLASRKTIQFSRKEIKKVDAAERLA